MSKKFKQPKLVNFTMESDKKKQLDLLLTLQEKKFSDTMNELIDLYFDTYKAFYNEKIKNYEVDINEKN